jgi:hypothetical protein
MERVAGLLASDLADQGMHSGYSPGSLTKVDFLLASYGHHQGNGKAKMIYQLGWTTLPGLRGLSVSEFRAVPAATPDNEKGVTVSFARDNDCDAFVQHLEEHFASRRFTNAADAFDSVKAYVLESAAKRNLTT